MQGKKVSDSKVIMARLMDPQDANPAGNVHGGVIVRLIDTCGGVAAIRHARKNVVTATIEKLDFLHPVYVGNLVTCKACVNLVGKSSMEVGVRVEAEDLRTGQVRKTASAYLTYVAIDKSGNPTEVPPLIIETPDEIRRHCEAARRKEARLRDRARLETDCQPAENTRE